MKEYSEQQLNEIVNGFLDRTLEKSLWTHHAHIITAIWHLMKFDKEDALCRLKSGIISYNLATGGENTGQAGYHETITIFWWEIIHQFLERTPGHSFTDTCNVFLASSLADKNILLKYYSSEVLFSPASRSRFINPDREEIKI
jgi:hypothetical protein